jgi:hypothetical protein
MTIIVKSISEKYGGNGGEKQEIDLGEDERIEIRGRTGVDGDAKVITYLEFQTSAKTTQFGKKEVPGGRRIHFAYRRYHW